MIRARGDRERTAAFPKSISERLAWTERTAVINYDCWFPTKVCYPPTYLAAGELRETIPQPGTAGLAKVPFLRLAST